MFYEQFILKVSQNKDDYLKYDTDVTRKKERGKWVVERVLKGEKGLYFTAANFALSLANG